ncbi:MAG: hypothetical protein H0T42_34535 [Deltaproteobacteria bacterium]|nr:hypothetical protein [Deltaproteobacteria bacterium]
MQFFLKAVITGFALSLGGALYKRVEKQLGLDPEKETKEREREEALRRGDAASDPDLH